VCSVQPDLGRLPTAGLAYLQGKPATVRPDYRKAQLVRAPYGTIVLQGRYFIPDLRQGRPVPERWLEGAVVTLYGVVHGAKYGPT